MSELEPHRLRHLSLVRQWFSPLFWYARRALSPQFWGTSNSGLPPQFGGLRGASAPVEVAIEMCISGSLRKERFIHNRFNDLTRSEPSLRFLSLPRRG